MTVGGSYHDPKGLRKVSEEVLGADSSTLSAVPVTLLTASLDTAQAKLIILAEFNMGHTLNNADGAVRLLLDSAELDSHREMDMTRKTCSYGSTISALTSVTAAAHTVELQWSTPAGTLLCNAVTDPDHHCRLVVIEVIASN